MSMSDSDFSSGGDYKNFRQITRDRLLYEMLRSTMSKDSKARRKELIEKVSKGDLPKNEYQCMNDPSPSLHETSNSGSIRTTHTQPAHSMRSRRTATWARPRSSDDGYSSDSVLRDASSDFKKIGQRIFVFVIGGATRSELRVVHKLTSKLNREIILGSTSLDDPAQFITKLKLLSAEDISLDGLQI